MFAPEPASPPIYDHIWISFMTAEEEESSKFGSMDDQIIIGVLAKQSNAFVLYV